MRQVGWLGAGLGLGLAVSCNAQEFNCQDDDDCGGDGTCQASGYCSFPDAGCESGQRYGDLAGAGLAGECVNPPSDTDPNQRTTATTTGPATATTTGPSAGSTSAAVDDSSTGSVSTSTSTDDGTTDDSGSSSTTSTEPYMFFDDFERPDSMVLGNDWIEADPDVFTLLGGEVEIVEPVGTSYETNVAYRPRAEAVADVETSVLIRFSDDGYPGIPQIYARVSNVGITGLDAYLCFYSSSGDLELRRQNGAEENDLALGVTPLQFAVGTDYRLRMRVQGANPVQVECVYEEITAGGSVELGFVSAMDSDAGAHTGPGVVGFSTHTSSQPYRYDDFSAVEL